MKNKFVFLIPAALLTAMLCTFYACTRGNSGKQGNNDRIGVVTSFYPLYFFAKEIGNGKADVINLTPSGAEPHDYEPNTRDIVRIEKARLLIMNGAALEPYAGRLKDILKNTQVKVVMAAEGLTAHDLYEEGRPTIDPHVWLDPLLAKQIVKRIEDAFASIDPGNRDIYESNAQMLEDRLDSLNKAFKNGLSDCKTRDIVTSHAAFGYIASRYKLRQIAISGISPDREPSPKKLAEISDFVKEHKIKYIFYETLISSRLAETIARETGAQVLVFNPLEGLTKEEQDAGKDYFSVQKDNLEYLKTALGCK